MSYLDLTKEEQGRVHLSIAPLQHVPTLAELADTGYWDAHVVSHGAVPEEYELLRELLAEWTWRMHLRGHDPKAEMGKLIDAAEQRGYPVDSPPAVRADRIGSALDDRAFERARHHIMQRYRRGRIEGWSDDVAHSLSQSPLLKEDQELEVEDASDYMFVAWCTGQPGVAPNQIAHELEQIWLRDLSYGSTALEEAYTIGVRDNQVVLKWAAAAPRDSCVTGRIVVRAAAE